MKKSKLNSVMDKIIAKVYETYDYGRFSIMKKGNREIDHQSKIEKSILENGLLLSPILVNEKNEIIDGQNRFEASKALNKPVRYIIVHGYGIEQVRVLNSDAKNWSKRDFIKSFADEGNPEYILIQKFLKKYTDFSAHICEYLLRLSTASGGDKSKAKNNLCAMKKGTFKIVDLARSEKIANILLCFKQFHPNIYKRTTFVVAIIKLERDIAFDHEEVVRKIQLNPRSFVPCINSDEYIRMIEDIVNFRSRNKVRFNI